MEFPRHLHKADGFYVVVTTEDEYREMKRLGWADQPPAHVEQPKPVRLAEARAEPVGEAPKAASGELLGIAALSVEDAKPLIAAASSVELAAMRAEEVAGKKRKGVLALIDVREADLIGD